MSDYSAGIPGCRPADLGPALRRLRREHRVLGKTIAQRVGVSHTYISGVERGLYPISITAAVKYAAALGHEVHLTLTHPLGRCTARIEEAGYLLAAARAARQEPATVVAKAAGTAATRLHEIEHGLRMPHLPWLAQVCRALDVEATVTLLPAPPPPAPARMALQPYLKIITTLTSAPHPRINVGERGEE